MKEIIFPVKFKNYFRTIKAIYIYMEKGDSMNYQFAQILHGEFGLPILGGRQIGNVVRLY